MLDTIKINDNIFLHYIPMQKLKTTSLGLYIHTDLKKETASLNALIPYVLKRGCNMCSNTAEIAKYLENLYGASMDAGVIKKGEDQIIGFNFESISDKYTPERENLLERLTTLMLSIVFEPVIEDNAFSKIYVEQEKKNLIDRIGALINDKRSYASWRCLEVMCQGEDMSVYKLGDKDSVANIDANMLYEHYKNVITSSKIDIFVCGDVEIKSIESRIKQYTDKFNFKPADYVDMQIYSKNGDVKKVTDRLDVTQGKISLGFRTNIKVSDKQYFGLLVMNSIFGGGAHSKLFNNVREKLSLAYYASSQLEKFKGLMIVNAGIEFENYQKAHDEILVQLDSIKKGEISDKEFQSSKEAIINALNSYFDNGRYMQDFYLGERISGSEYDLNYMIEHIKMVTVDDVIEAANKVELDTVYFLAGKGDE